MTDLQRNVHDFARVMEHALGIDQATSTAERIAKVERDLGAPTAPYWSQVSDLLSKRNLVVDGVEPMRQVMT